MIFAELVSSTTLVNMGPETIVLEIRIGPMRKTAMCTMKVMDTELMKMGTATCSKEVTNIELMLSTDSKTSVHLGRPENMTISGRARSISLAS